MNCGAVIVFHWCLKWLQTCHQEELLSLFICVKAGTHQAEVKKLALPKSTCCRLVSAASGTVWTKKLCVNTPNRRQPTETRVRILCLSVFSFHKGKPEYEIWQTVNKAVFSSNFTVLVTHHGRICSCKMSDKLLIHSIYKYLRNVAKLQPASFAWFLHFRFCSRTLICCWITNQNTLLTDGWHWFYIINWANLLRC